LNIFKAKRRPLSDPLIVHVHDKNHIYTDKPDFLDSFAELFWPGPFTIVLKYKINIIQINLIRDN